MGRVKKFLYFISDKKLTIGSAAVILAITSLISNFLGLGREMILAGLFGVADHEAGIYQGAFRLPDFIFNLFILGAFSSAFIPIFISKIEQKAQKAWNYANNILNFLLLTALVGGIILFIFTPQLLPFIMPGYFWNEADRNTEIFQTAVNITRILTLSPILFTIGNLFGGILNSFKKFIYFSLAPIVYNLSIIISASTLKDIVHPVVYAPVIGVIIGAFLYSFVQLPSVLSSGFRYKPFLNFKNGDILHTLKLMFPRSLAIGVGQINLLVDTVIASFFTGGIAVIAYANNIQTLPTVVFGISVATAVFPFLTESFARKNQKAFLSSFSWGTRRILFFIIPATVGLIILRAQIVRLVFGNDVFNNGKFDWVATYWTAKTLGFFAFGLIGQALIPILLKAYYAMYDTKTPLLIGVVVMIVNILLSLTLPFLPALNLGISGIALAFSISGFLNAGLLFYFLHKKIGALDRDHKIFDSTFRLIISSIVMGVVVHYSLYFFDFFLNTQRVVGLIAQTFGAIGIAAATYFLLTYLFKCEEINFLLKKFRKPANQES